MGDSSITIRQLAKLAGVSRSTASLAMQNSPKLSAKTRAHVQKTAKKHGYVPDPLTSTLMSHLRVSRKVRRDEKIAYLTWWDTPDQWQHPGNESMWFRGAQRRAQSLGYDLEPIWASEPGMTASRLGTVLYTRNIRGVVIAPLAKPGGRVDLDFSHLAAAAIGYTVDYPVLHRSAHSHPSGMLIALQQLQSYGYKRIGFANLQNQIKRVGYGWLGGYLLHQQGCPPSRRIPALIVKQWNQAKFAEWFHTHRPDAIVSNHHEPLNLVAKLGYRVPEDIGFANLDLHAVYDYAGVDQQPQKVGSATVDLVIGQLLKNEFGLPNPAKTVTIEGLWVDGPTALNKKSLL